MKYLLIYFVIYIFHFIIEIAPGDDTLFSGMSSQYTLTEYLSMRYNGWTGRLSGELFFYFFLGGKVWLWKFINAGFIMLVAYSLVRIIREKNSLRYFIVALCIMGYFSQSILSSGVFWITGSMIYLWSIAMGLFAMIPFADYTFRNNYDTSNRRILLSLLTGLLAVFANEQAALCMVIFGLISITTYFIKTKKYSIRLIFLTVIFLVGTIISIKAPGNSSRFVSETATWFPNFNELSLKDHLYLGVIWFFGKAFTELKWLLLLISVGTLYVFNFQSNNMKQTYVTRLLNFIFIILVATSFSILIIGNPNNVLFDFEAIRNFHFGHNLINIWTIEPKFILALIPYMFWSIFSLLLISMLIMISERKWFILLCLAAAIASMCIMFFSPTIYASGNRTLTVSAALLSLVSINVLNKIEFKNKLGYIFIFAFPAVNILSLLMIWIVKGYYILY